MKRNKIVHVSTVHYWQDARILDKECMSLASAGYDVSLIIQHEGDTNIKGVRLIGLPVARTKPERIYRGIPVMLWKVIKQPSDTVIHLHDPELLIFGWFFKVLGFKVIYDVHEDLPKDILAKEWIPKILRKPLSVLASKLEFLLTAPLDGVVTVTPGILERFSHTKNVLVRNFPKLDLFLRNESAEKVNYVVYVGDIRRVRGAREMVKAFQLLRHKELLLKLGGRIYPKGFGKELNELDVQNRMDLLGWIPHQDIPELLSKALCGLVVLHPVDGYKEAYSVKMFEYMASGIPVIASNFPVWRQIIEKADCGLLVDPLDPVAIAESIETLAENPQEVKRLGQNGRRAAKALYGWENEEKKLIRFYEEVIHAI